MLGGVLGHSLCTGLAVLGGRMIAQKISVKTGIFDMYFMRPISNIQYNYSDTRWWSSFSHICCIGTIF